MKRNPIPYGRQWIDEDDIQAVIETLRGDWITQGPKVAEFEESFAAYCGSKYAVAVSSGTAALHLAAIAAGFKAGEEVITSPMSFVASANCVMYEGARPVFADVERETLCIDPHQVAEKINPSTRGVIPVHFAGHPCDMPLIQEISGKHDLIVIEDACHALGASYTHYGKTYRVGSCAHSHMACFSFHPVKHITTGEGGMITTNDERLFRKLRGLRSHGITKDSDMLTQHDGPWYYEMHELGFNYRITDIQCALGLEQLKKLDRFVDRRREIVNSYNRSFNSAEELILPREKEKVTSSWHLYVIQLNTLDRLEVFEKLHEKGLGVQVHYIPVHLQPFYSRSYGYRRGHFPVAEKYYDRAVSIPLFPRMSETDVDYVIDSVIKTVGELSR